MESLRIDDGFKSFMINDDPNRVIRFNPGDLGIIERIKDAKDNIDKYMQTIEKDLELDENGEPIDIFEAEVNVLSKFRDYIFEQYDHIFDSKVSETLFGKQSPLSMVGGIPFYERVLDAILPFVTSEIKKQQKESQKRIEKYTKQVK